MKPVSPPLDLDTTRRGIAHKMRELRLARGWTQAQLAERLGLSQARLSVIERGGGTISAEQFVVLMALFNVPIEDFLPTQDPEDEIQNALARLGALHLREVPGVLASTRLREVTDVVREVLVSPRASRLVTALAPVLVRHIDMVNLDLVLSQLAALGLGRRLAWLLENVCAALASVGGRLPGEWALNGRRATLVLGELANRLGAQTRPAEPSPETPIDYFDPAIRGMKTAAIVWHNADPIARRWGIVTELVPEDFAQALLEAANG